VNTLDALVLLLAASAAVGGYRLGFLARAASWIGLVLGGALGAVVGEALLERFPGASEDQAFWLFIGALLGLAFVGQASGLLLGRLLHVALPVGGARQTDRAAGAVAGVVGVVLGLWLILPIIAEKSGWFAVQARTSVLAELVDEELPEPPNTALRRFVNEGRFPRVFDALEPAPDLGPPPAASGLSEELLDVVVPSTVKVQGTACRRIQEGSGFVVGDGLVVTNAHVVAGESETILQRSDGSDVEATVVAFDPNRDLAVLRVPDLDRPALALGAAEPGDTGAVFGHPGGGPLRVAPFEVGREVRATGTDIYDAARTERQVLVLAAELRPGDSGAALVDPAGEVIGVAFAIAPDRAGVAYALDLAELEAVLAGDLTEEVDTGPCLR
jgi:S1-C subfamily serine protease